MRSAFSRTLSIIIVTLMLAFLAIGTSFQLLMKNYLTGRFVADLQTDGQVLVKLVQAAYRDNAISGRDFNIAFSVAASVSGSDAVICDENGRILMCASAPLGCEHQGLMLDDHVPFLTGDTRWGHTARSNAFGYLRGMLKVLQLQEQ